MKNLRLVIKRYGFIREAVMNIGSLVEFVTLYAVYVAGEQQWGIVILLLASCIIINNLLSRGWLWLIKH